jgi:zinc transport system ATP-binding protein
MSERPIIEVKNLNFSYSKEQPVLENISFSVPAGDYVGILGPNGGGKTTLLKILVGLLKPTTGAVTIFGKDIYKLKNRTEIGYVPQRIAEDNATFPATVYEIVESGLTTKKGLLGMITASDRQSIEDTLKLTNILDLKHRLMGQLSGGQRQRVYLARALASQPKILILDEPFVGVDPTSQKDFYNFLKELNAKQGLTILFVSHDIDTITGEVKSILCINRGLFCYGGKELIAEEEMIEKVYGKSVTHIHHPH